MGLTHSCGGCSDFSVPKHKKRNVANVDEKMQEKPLYNQDIIEQLIKFKFTKDEIINAMKNVVDRNNINEVMNFLNSEQKPEEEEEKYIQTPVIAMKKFKQDTKCIYKQPNGEWCHNVTFEWNFAKQSIRWSYLDKTQKRVKLKTKFDIVYVHKSAICFEYTDNKKNFRVYEFRDVEVLEMMNFAVKHNLIKQSNWITPLMYSIKQNDDERLWNECQKWLKQQNEKELANIGVNNPIDMLLEHVRSKLIATETISQTIKSISKRHFNLKQIISDQDKTVLTDDAKQYVDEAIEVSDKLWDLCLEIKTFLYRLSMEGELNRARIEQWRKIKNIQALDNPQSPIYQKVEKGIQKIINFGSNDRIQKIGDEIQSKLEEIMSGLTKLEKTKDRFQTIKKEKEIKVSNKSKLIGGTLFAGLIASCGVTSVAIVAVLGAFVLANPIGLLIGGGIAAVLCLGGTAYYGGKMIKSHLVKERNKKIIKTENVITEFHQAFDPNTLSKNCKTLEIVINELQNILQARNDITSDADFEPSGRFLDALDRVFADCVDRFNEMSIAIKETQYELLNI